MRSRSSNEPTARKLPEHSRAQGITEADECYIVQPENGVDCWNLSRPAGQGRDLLVFSFFLRIG